MDKVDLTHNITIEYMEGLNAIRSLLKHDKSIFPANAMPDYAIINIDSAKVIAVGITWDAENGLFYSAKWDTIRRHISDLYLVYNTESEYFSSQIDHQSLEPIVHYKHEGDIETKLDAKTLKALQVNTLVKNGNIPPNIMTKLQDIKFPFTDKILLHSVKPYGNIVEFDIRHIVMK